MTTPLAQPPKKQDARFDDWIFRLWKRLTRTSSTELGLGTMADQDADAVAITGGTVNADLTGSTNLPIASGISGLGTGIATALSVNTGSAGAPVLFNGALGTPSSGTVTNLTGTASININGTVGATTPTTGAFTTLTTSSTITSTGAITQSSSNGGSTNTLTVKNTSNTASSASRVLVQTGGTSAGDAYTGYYDGANLITVGIKAGDSTLYFGSNGPSGTVRAALSTTGLGLGTSTPNYLLQLHRAAAASSVLQLSNTASGSGATDGLQIGLTNALLAEIWQYENADMRFGTNNTERMRIDSNGNVGIGLAAPLAKLHIYSLGTSGVFEAQRLDSTANYNAGRGVSQTFYVPYGTNSNILGASIAAITPSSGTADLVLSTGVAGTLTERLRVTSAGYVGIGTISPLSALDVRADDATTNGVVRVLSVAHTTTGVAAAGIGAGIAFRSEDAGGTFSTLAYIDSIVTDATAGAVSSAITISTRSGGGTVTERMRIDSSGNVLVTSSGGLGYGTGSGGTVTQATSRTTGVTLNKTNGAITLVSAAGSATWQSFTLTNSTIAATDTVRVCQKSGTDLYQIHVTAVAAGSCQITYATTGGTTTEQPVFNFAVIKGVTS